MSVESAPYFWVVCDRCKARADYGDFAAWSDEWQAVERLDDIGWAYIVAPDGSESHYCDGCAVWDEDADIWVADPTPFVAGGIVGYFREVSTSTTSREVTHSEHV